MPLHPAPGDLAPDFTLADDRGEPVTLSGFRGRIVVLYFYPKDDTPGCTVESCEFRDLVPRFDDAGAVILGVSPDSVASHAKFRRKYQLDFPLLADVDTAVARAYGVWQQKSLFGYKYMGNLRTTFIIGRGGHIAKVFEKVKARGHAEEVARAVTELG